MSFKRSRRSGEYSVVSSYYLFSFKQQEEEQRRRYELLQQQIEQQKENRNEQILQRAAQVSQSVVSFIELIMVECVLTKVK